MSKKTTAAIIIIVSIITLTVFGIVQDLNRTVDANSERIDTIENHISEYNSINDTLFFGTRLRIPKEIYYQDWVYFQSVDCRVYDKDDVMLVYGNHSEETVLVQFPHVLDDGYLYYNYEANVSNGWWKPNYNTRCNITFEQTLVDDFNETISDGSVWRVR